MGSIIVFNAQISDFFHGPLSLICTRDFESGYSVEYSLDGNIFKAWLEEPGKLAGVYTDFLEIEAAAKARGGEMKPRPLWGVRRGGLIEIGIGDKYWLYVQAGDVRIEPNTEERLGPLLTALIQMKNDWAEVTHANSRSPPPNYDPELIEAAAVAAMGGRQQMVMTARLGTVPTSAERADEALALAREALQRVAELEKQVATLQSTATGPQKPVDEDGVSGPAGRWMRVPDAAIATKFSQSALRKMVRERRCVADFEGCHPLINIDSIPDRSAKVRK